MKRILVFLASAFFLTGIASTSLFAQQPGPTGGELTVPWDEFKRLLNLDESKIVLPLETFQKLLAQTGAQAAPAHTVQGGNVVMSREEFQKLVGQMRPPTATGQQPPFDFLITRAAYRGSLQRNNAAFSATFAIHVLKDEAYLKVPLLPQSIALENLTIDGRQALVVSEDGFHQVVLAHKGEYLATATFSLKGALENGPQKIDLPIRQTPITLLDLQMPLSDIDVDIPQAQHLQTSGNKNGTAVSAIITPGNSISIRWRKQVAAAEKVPAKLYSELQHLISIGDDVLSTTTTINFTILHSEIDAVRLAIPEGVNVLTVYGEGVGEWQEVRQQNQQILNIPFTYGKKGTVSLVVTTENALADNSVTSSFSGIRVLDAVRETGFVGIELNTSAEVLVNENDGLEKVPPQKLPVQLSSRSAKPLMLGFKYLKHPFSLVLDIRKHQKIAVPVAAINEANVVTLLTEDGKLVNRLIYQITNSARQFLQVQLPEDANVWSVFVNDQPVECSLNDEGKLLIPLLRSQIENNRLAAFPVEVIYAQSLSGFGGFGSRTTRLPVADLMTSQILWSLYLPNDYSYPWFSSSLEKEEMIRGLNIFARKERRFNQEDMDSLPAIESSEQDPSLDDRLRQAYGSNIASSFRNAPMEQKKLKSQLEAEMGFGQRLDGLGKQELAAGAAAGVLPIQIKVPTSGQLYRFARTIVNPEDPLTVRVVYLQQWLISLLYWSAIALLALLLYRLRDRIFLQIAKLRTLFQFAYKNWLAYKPRMIELLAARMTPFVLLGVLILAWPFSFLIALSALFLLWISVVYQWLNRSKVKPLAVKGDEPDVELTIE